jgi:hypothetical protein
MKRSISSVSVIIPCYCCSETIERAVQSIFQQTVLPREVILIEDCSPDESKTKKKLESLEMFYSKNRPQVKFKSIFSPVNAGPGAARNLGWNFSSSQYVAFLDADDSWMKNKLEVQYGWMNKHPNIFLSCHLTEFYANTRISNKIKNQVFNQTITLFDMLFSNKISTRSVMVKNNERYRFDNSARYSEDYSLWLRMISDGMECARINQYLAFTYKREYSKGGQSQNLLLMQIGEIKAITQLRKNGSIGIMLYAFCCLWSVLKFIKRVVVSLMNI